MASGTAVTTQTPGDCHTRRCDGAGNVIDEVDDTDGPFDRNQCSGEGCSAGTPIVVPGGAGWSSTCTYKLGVQCDNYGACIGCTSAYDCQTDSRCTNPINTNCAHSKCAMGVNLSPGCDPPASTGPQGCVAEICASTVDPSCCVAASSTTGCTAPPCQVQPSKPTGCPASVQAAIDSVVGAIPACGTAWTQACVDKFRQQPGIGCGWDATCVGRVGTVCQIDCSVDAETGQCLPWNDGEKAPTCAGVDLTLGLACDSYVPVCNRGQSDVSGAIRLWIYPANSAKIPSDSPTGAPAPDQCIVTKTINAGTCVDVTAAECAFNGNNKEIVVNPQGALTNPTPIKECTAKNNWTLYSLGTECHKPVCSGRTVMTSRLPVNLFVMLDRSGSMATLSSDGVTTKDSLAKSALTAFFQNAAVAGTRIYFRGFPDAVDSSPAGTACVDKNTCTGTSTTGTQGTEVTACSVPDPIPGCDPATNACTLPSTDLVTWVNNTTTNSNGTPSLIAILGAEKWAMAYKAAHPNENVAVILMTDGTPSSPVCSTIASAAIADPAYGVATAYNAGVRTYIVGMYDTSVAQTATDFLYFDPIAAAGQGHSTCSAMNPCPAPGTCVSTCKAAGQTCVSDADCCAGYGSCTGVPKKCSVGTSPACKGLAVDASNAAAAQIATKLVGIHAQAAGCTWQIDACRGAGAVCTANANCCSNICTGGVCIGGNGAFDPSNVSVTYTPSMGTPTIWVPGGCDAFKNGAYFDNAAAPSTLTLCPTTCATVQADPNPVIRLWSGC